jgi:hypothetical protein
MAYERFNFLDDFAGAQDEDSKYTKKALIPQYTPSLEKPNIEVLCNKEKFRRLKEEILSASDISAEEKEFLLYAATRHIVFNYAQIADYYAHSNKTMQELMEKSALVIIDFDNAIANGYVKLSRNIRGMLDDTDGE